MWQHKAAELLYESACFEPTVFVQIRGHHVSQAREFRFEHEVQKTFQTQVRGTHEERATHKTR